MIEKLLKERQTLIDDIMGRIYRLTIDGSRSTTRFPRLILKLLNQRYPADEASLPDSLQGLKVLSHVISLDPRVDLPYERLAQHLVHSTSGEEPSDITVISLANELEFSHLMDAKDRHCLFAGLPLRFTSHDCKFNRDYMFSETDMFRITRASSHLRDLLQNELLIAWIVEYRRKFCATHGQQSMRLNGEICKSHYNDIIEAIVISIDKWTQGMHQGDQINRYFKNILFKKFPLDLNQSSRTLDIQILSDTMERLFSGRGQYHGDLLSAMASLSASSTQELNTFWKTVDEHFALSDCRLAVEFDAVIADILKKLRAQFNSDYIIHVAVLSNSNSALPGGRYVNPNFFIKNPKSLADLKKLSVNLDALLVSITDEKMLTNKVQELLVEVGRDLFFVNLNPYNLSRPNPFPGYLPSAVAVSRNAAETQDKGVSDKAGQNRLSLKK